MAVYMILKITIQDAKKLKEYQKLAPSIVASHGGKFLARGGELVSLEGDDTRRTIIMEFPSMEKAKCFYNSTEYVEARLLRKDAAMFDVVIVEGVENQ